MRYVSGLTLLELLITISIIALLMTIGVPSMLGMQKTLQLKGAVEVTYYAFQQARSQAITSGSNISVILNDSNQWCIALSDSGPCDCTVQFACTVNGIEQKVSGLDFHLVTLQNTRFGPNSEAIFDGVRGLSIGNAGSAVFSDGYNQVKLILSNMGRLRICTSQGQLGAYQSC